jgi:hypothetical protein
MTDLTIRPFEVHVPDEDLTDLQRRVAATRWPGKELVADQSQGVQLATVQTLVTYWGTGYDWRRCEAQLNALPQFVTEMRSILSSRRCLAMASRPRRRQPAGILAVPRVAGPR